MKKTASGYRLIFGYLGLFIAFVGVALLLPLIGLIDPLIRPESYDWYCFVIPSAASIIGGSFMFGILIAGRTKAQLGKHQDSILLVLIWLCAIFISAVPFLLEKDMNLSFTDAMFETTSCYATVGLSIFKPEFYEGVNPHRLFVIYRAVLCFLGGIGLVLIITSAISDRYGLKLYLAEGHNDKLMPNLARSARIILALYSGFMIFGFILYMLAGMNSYEAFVHSISAFATAGFSTKPDGIAGFAASNRYWAIQVVSIILMILGALNFLLALFLITGKFKKVFKDCEVKFFGILCLIFIPVFFVSALYARAGQSVGAGKTFVESSFTYLSAITTTGFANLTDLKTLGQGTLLLVTVMTIIGGGMGSTSGGVKQYRFVLAFKSFYWNTREATASSNKIFPHFVYRCGSDKEVHHDEIANALGFILLYVTVLFVGSLLVCVFNKGIDPNLNSFGDSLFEFANALSCTGLSVGVSQASTVPAKWTFIAGMFAGRLEILAIYFAFFRAFRDLFRKETY